MGDWVWEAEDWVVPAYKTKIIFLTGLKGSALDLLTTLMADLTYFVYIVGKRIFSPGPRLRSNMFTLGYYRELL